MTNQIIALFLIIIFYTAYFVKNLSLILKNIKVNHLGKGTKPFRTLLIETILKTASIIIVVVQIYSLITNKNQNSIGLFIVALGVITFITSVIHMKKSWRVGISNEKSKLIKNGIYKFSRNPAFLGFDLMYIGILITFPNWVHFITTVLTIIIFHIQILEEEKHLHKVFGKEYTDYKKRVGRYF
ncbi:MAG: isoprenylcysteine carboxylmethyltransferase family protein [Rickettsiales bacterium]|jgi:protein-S-isoprenylcysteine O-methyltransferase Ste14|nr:isoprenylcysteine carboxylmethyltransferase family protein [Rickettsiales bacterium]